MKNDVLVMVFPGQGTQKVGMLSTYFKHHLMKETFTEASDILGYDLQHLIQYGPSHELNKTYYAQPAILATSVAIWRMWKERDGQAPKFLAGHSLGEYSALVCAGVINFSSAIRLVELRGIFMQNVVAPNVGAMSAIFGLDENLVIEICKKVTSHSEFVSLSAFNAPNHVVISGYRKSVERVNAISKKLGAKFVFILPISIPSHCELMLPAAKKLRKELEKIKFSLPLIPVVNNVDVCVEDKPKNIKNALVRQIYTPIRWWETIEYFIQSGVNVLVEVGPGRVLSTMVKRVVDSSILDSMSMNEFLSLDFLIKN